MTADLANTIELVASPAFRAAVEAVVTEHAIAAATTSPGTPSEHLAARVVYDAASVVGPFVRLAADDPAISAAGADYDEADLRTVVAEAWALVAAAIPNLGT